MRTGWPTSRFRCRRRLAVRSIPSAPGCPRSTTSAAERILEFPRRSWRPRGDDTGVSAEPSGTDAAHALLALYDDALPVVYGYFVRRCGARGTAEDLTSETFLAAMDAARKADPPPMTVPWLIGVARHKLADHYRRRHDRFTEPVAELPEPEPD